MRPIDYKYLYGISTCNESGEADGKREKELNY